MWDRTPHISNGSEASQAVSSKKRPSLAWRNHKGSQARRHSHSDTACVSADTVYGRHNSEGCGYTYRILLRAGILSVALDKDHVCEFLKSLVSGEKHDCVVLGKD